MGLVTLSLSNAALTSDSALDGQARATVRSTVGDKVAIITTDNEPFIVVPSDIVGVINLSCTVASGNTMVDGYNGAIRHSLVLPSSILGVLNTIHGSSIVLRKFVSKFACTSIECIREPLSCNYRPRCFRCAHSYRNGVISVEDFLDGREGRLSLVDVVDASRGLHGEL